MRQARRRAGLVLRGLLAFGAATAVMTTTSVLAAPASVTLSPSLTVRSVDTTALPQAKTVKIDAVMVGGVAPAPFTVTENGKAVSGLSSQSWTNAGVASGTVLVIDTAAAMTSGDRLASTKIAAKNYIAHKPAHEIVAIVAAGAVPRVVLNFTGDVGQLNGAIDLLAPQGEQALYDALKAGAALFNDRPERVRNMVVVSNGADKLSTTKGGAALAALQSSKAAVFTVGLPGGPGYSSATMKSLAIGGGQYLEVSDPTELTAAFGAVQSSFQQGVELTYQSNVRPGVAMDIAIVSQGQAVHLHTVAGALSIGSNASPDTVTLQQAPGPLRNKAGVFVIALMVVLAAGLFAYAVLALVTSEKSDLELALQPYDEAATPADDDDDSSLVQSALVARAVEATGRFADRQGILQRVETMLEQADLAVRPAEAFFFYAVAVILVVVAALFANGLLIAFMALVITGLAPPAVLSYLAGRRVRKFNTQLPDTLQLLASSLRAGFSFLQGVEAVAAEAQKPMADELQRVLIEARLGRPVETALQDCADRMKSADFDWAVMAVRIQREVGGNLAELLQTVSETMIERERLRRDVKSLTAEGRVSAIVLGLMPPGLGATFYVTNPKYMGVLFSNSAGQIALAVAIVAIIIGFLWMKKVVDIEV